MSTGQARRAMNLSAQHTGRIMPIWWRSRRSTTPRMCCGSTKTSSRIRPLITPRLSLLGNRPRVLPTDGDRYVLRHEGSQDIWTLVGYRVGSGSVSRCQADGRRCSVATAPRQVVWSDPSAPDHVLPARRSYAAFDSLGNDGFHPASTGAYATC